MKLDFLIKNCRILFLGFMYVYATCLLSSCSLYLDHKENEMKEQFSKNFDIFTMLIKMQKEDEKFSSIADTWTDISLSPALQSSFKNYHQEISKERWDFYRDMFIQAGIESGMRRAYMLGRGEVRHVQFYLKASTFGFSYIEKPPARVFRSFRECRAIKFDHKYRCYVYLKEKWYLHMGVNNEPKPM